MRSVRDVLGLVRPDGVAIGPEHHGALPETMAAQVPRQPKLNVSVLLAVPAILGWVALLDWAIGLPAW